MPTPEQKAAALRVRDETARTILVRMPFRDRGLSDRTIEALVGAGIDAPERLLFATEAELKRLPGIGKAAFSEIMRYRLRFLPEHHQEQRGG
jgi:DNA-directed RNA polymerase alpha subunit